MPKIKVIVVKQNDREHLQARWFDPQTGRKRYKTTGETNERKALKFAAKLEEKLESETYSPDSGVTWEEFRERFRDGHLSSIAQSTSYKYEIILNGFEDIIKIRALSSIDTAKVNKYASALRKRGCAEATIKGYLSYIRAALNWACDMGMIQKVPKIIMPKRAKNSKHMKGRPITSEEFERILSQIHRIVDQGHVSDWEFFLKGLWWSGLRLGEAIILSWHTGPFAVVEIDDRYFFMISSDAEKGGQDRLLATAPQFEEMLREVKNKKGRVFNPMTSRSKGVLPRIDVTGRLIKKISIKANVVADPEKGTYATAHDFRRSFGVRWAQLILPQQLMELMRHSDIKTTLNYYVGKNAKNTSDVLWNAINQEKGLQNGLQF